MARLPYLPADLAEPRDIVDDVRARRGGKLTRVDRLLLYSPPLASAWNVYANTIRTRLALPAKLRELAIVAVSSLMHTDHEINVHGPHFLSAGGSPEQLQAILDVESASTNTELFDEVERAALRLAFEMTRSVTVDQATFSAVVSALGGAAPTIELIAVIATYNMTNRVLMALEFETEAAAAG